MKPMFSGSSSASSEPLKSGMPSKLTANTTSEARPHSISSTSSTKPKIASVPVRVSQASSESPKSGVSPRSSLLADVVQAQAQERPHQQEAGRQRQHVGRRVLEDLQQHPAHDREAAAVEEADAGAAEEVAPALGQPAQRVGEAQRVQHDRRPRRRLAACLSTRARRQPGQGSSCREALGQHAAAVHSESPRCAGAVLPAAPHAQQSRRGSGRPRRA